MLTGVGQAINRPARWAILPQIVPRDLLLSAITWNTSTWQIAAMAGPALGGLVIALTGERDVVLPAQRGLLGRGDRAHLLATAPRRGARLAARLAAVAPGGATLRARDRPHPGDHHARPAGGLPRGCRGALADLRQGHPGDRPDRTGLAPCRPFDRLVPDGRLAGPPASHAARPGKSLLWAVAGFGVATIVFGLSTNPYLSFAMLFLTGALDNISVVVRQTLVQILTPDAMRGRVSAVNTIFIASSNELGEFESGVAARLLGTVPAVVAGGLGTIVVGGRRRRRLAGAVAAGFSSQPEAERR